MAREELDRFETALSVRVAELKSAGAGATGSRVCPSQAWRSCLHSQKRPTKSCSDESYHSEAANPLKGREIDASREIGTCFRICSWLPD
jgi:hypothetical protein